MTEPVEAGRYGTATITPADPVVAGSIGTWRLTYAAGPQGIAGGGRLRVYTECDTDWGLPQFDDPAGAEYTTCHAPDGVTTTVLLADDKGSLTVTLGGRALAPGERLVLTYGDRSGGGPGSRAQTFAEARRFFWVDVEDGPPGGRAGRVTLPDSPSLAVVGGAAAGLVVVAPSTVAVGAPFRLLVRAVDAWGNPAAAYRGTVGLRADGVDLPQPLHAFAAADGGVWWLDGCAAGRAGVLTVSAADTAGSLRAASNPICCTAAPPAYTLYWGDPHGGQIASAAKIPDFFRYARDVAGIAFAGYQRNDHVHSNADYAAQQAAEAAFAAPGRFVPLPGFEWSGEPPMGGHHNVYFRRPGQPMRRNSHAGLSDTSDAAADLPHVLDLHRAYRGTDTLITPHVGGGHADLRYHEPALEPALEIVSTHGTFEWFLRESLAHGYRMGFVGGSDSHDGRPGADTPGHQERRYAKGGLTGLYARDLTLVGLHEALAARRCYATTGARIVASVEVTGQPMGAAVRSTEPPTVAVSVAGTAPLEAVELYRGLECLHRHPPPRTPSPRRLRLLWEGASRRSSYSGVIWDGTLRLAGATIAGVDRLRFDSPRSAVSDVTATSLRWHSVTCGYRSGLVLELDARDPGAAGVRVTLATALISRPLFGGHGEAGEPRMGASPAERLALDVPLARLADGPLEVPIGTLERKLTLSLADAPGGSATAGFTFTDPSPHPGTNAYWVRVVQADMEMAWTSPVFVDFVAPPG
jgi:hypothetical protein